MRTRAREAVTSILQSGRMGSLRIPQTPGERLARLKELVPDFDNWIKPAQIQVIFDLQRDHGIFFGVCDFLEPDDHRLYCIVSGIKEECQCSIPKPSFCVFLAGRQLTPA